MICEYGCGKVAKYQFKNGKWCCEKHWMKCEISRKKIIDNNPLHDPEVLKKHRESCGSVEVRNKHRQNALKNNPMKRPDVLEKHKKIMSKLTGENNPLYTCDGALERHRESQRSEETRKKKSESTKKSIEKGIHHFSSHTYDLSGENSAGWKGGYCSNNIPMYDTYAERLTIEEMPERDIVDKNILSVICVKCKKRFIPSLSSVNARLRSLDGIGGESRLYCSEECKQSCIVYGKKINQIIKEDQIKAGIIKDQWYTDAERAIWSEEVRMRADHECEICGEEATHAHHIQPVKLEPGLALDPDNGIAVCVKCHYKYGHETGTECSTGNLANIICK